MYSVAVMELVEKREEFLAGESGFIALDGVSTGVAFRMFKRTFSCPAESEFYLGTEAKSMYYFFTSEPSAPTVDDASWESQIVRVHTSLRALEGLVDTLIAFIIYLDESKDVKFVFMPITSATDAVSAHAIMGKSIKNAQECTFAYAGHVMCSVDGQWQFDLKCASFVDSRTVTVQKMMDDAGDKFPDGAPFLSSIDGPLARAHCSELLRSVRAVDWQFVEKIETVTDMLGLDVVLRSTDSANLPFIMPDDPDKITVAQQALFVIGAFRHCSATNKWPSVYLNVNAMADEVGEVFTGAAPREEYKKRPFNQNAPFGANGENLNVNVADADLKRALTALKTTGARRLGSPVKRDSRVKFDEDMHGVIGKTFRLYTKDGDKMLTVDRFLAKSNAIIYLGDMDGQKVVIKLGNLYINLLKNMGFAVDVPTPRTMGGLPDESAFYHTQVFRFKVPGTMAVAEVIPYLGKPIDSMPFEDRIKVSRKFREQLIEAFCSVKLVGGQFGSTVKSVYNDIKPQNTTVDDNGDFHLIDLDGSAYTPSYYGDTVNQSIQSQCFGLALLILWFDKDAKPFADGTATWEQKKKWVTDNTDPKKYHGHVLRLVMSDGFAPKTPADIERVFFG